MLEYGEQDWRRGRRNKGEERTFGSGGAPMKRGLKQDVGKKRGSI